MVSINKWLQQYIIRPIRIIQLKKLITHFESLAKEYSESGLHKSAAMAKWQVKKLKEELDAAKLH